MQYDYDSPDGNYDDRTDDEIEQDEINEGDAIDSRIDERINER